MTWYKYQWLVKSILIWKKLFSINLEMLWIYKASLAKANKLTSPKPKGTDQSYSKTYEDYRHLIKDRLHHAYATKKQEGTCGYEIIIVKKDLSSRNRAKLERIRYLIPIQNKTLWEIREKSPRTSNLLWASYSK